MPSDMPYTRNNGPSKLTLLQQERKKACCPILLQSGKNQGHRKTILHFALMTRVILDTSLAKAKKAWCEFLEPFLVTIDTYFTTNTSFE